MAQFPANIDLSSLNGANGFRLSATSPYDNNGRAVASAGDVNGDGLADVIVGAPSHKDPFEQTPGAAYVIFGRHFGFAADIPLASLDGTNGFKITGRANNDATGFAVASAGDVNGDGFADMMVGAYAADPNGNLSGATYVVFGKATGFPANLNAASLDGTNGFRLIGGSGSLYGSGYSIASAGDVNGDGFDDMIVGGFSDGNAGLPSPINAAIVFGKGTPFTADINLAALDGNNGFAFVNGVNVRGAMVASAGDVNGDGFDDTIIGAPGNAPDGVAYVVFGHGAPFSATFDLATLNGTNGFRLSGGTNLAGIAVASAGDLNGDGFADMIVSSYGLKYVVFGKSTPFTADVDLASLDGTNGFKISGVAADPGGIQGAAPVAAAGDVNGDGFDDLIIGADQANPHGSNSGASYVVFGKASGFAATLDVATLDGTNGFKLSGVARDDFTGIAADGAGDVNGDGFADLVMGAYWANTAGARSGASYVAFANLPDGPVNRVGSAAGQSISGGNFDDTLSGLGGDDHLHGNGGNDVLIGGPGADTLDGGGGNQNMVSYETSPAAVRVELLGAGTFGDAQGDTYIGIEDALGSAFNDVLVGTAVNNRLFGAGGNDILAGNAGPDVLDGGSGENTATYETAPNAVQVNLAVGSGIGGDANGDVLISIQDVIGSAFGDVLTGDAGFNKLFGGDGNDFLIGGAGPDLLEGGAGTDTAFYDASSAAVRVDLVSTLGTGGDAQQDVLHDIENVSGSGFDDLLIGNAGANRLSGNGGNDGLAGGAGADVLDGGAGNDTALYDTSPDAVQVNLAAGAGLNGDAQGDVLLGIENVTGSAFGDVLTGDNNDNRLNGGGGADQLTGGGGNDTFVFVVGQASGDTVVDFNGNGAAAGDSLEFVGYGLDATFTQVDASHWQVNYHGNTEHDVITFLNGAAGAIHPSDFVFG